MFKVGTRVKKVRGIKNLGVTGVVVPIPTEWSPPPLTRSAVRVDAPISIQDPKGAIMPAGSVVCVLTDQWEPIIPTGHMASSYSLEQLLDKEMYSVKA